ncbi:MAG: hypothetical protein FJ125_16715, partial [Deltaproteobacteria bacterium]|nr:hypothetical protein [Deltaproteobacteria bacterium]
HPDGSGYAGVEERCNGLDDDCDGEIDEGCRCGEERCPRHPLGWAPRCNGADRCEYRPASDGGVEQQQLSEQQAELWVPSGGFLMGSPDGEDGRGEAEGPVHPVTFARGFFLGKYEVTVARYEACAAEVPELCTTPSTVHWDGLGWGLNRIAGGRGSHPQNGLTWDQAQAFCSFSGGRLPSEAEWEYAASGPVHRRYPWGEAAADCTRAVFADDGGDVRPWGCDPCEAAGCSGTQPVGSVPAGASWCGALDMCGNVREWVEDWYHEGYLGAPADGSAWLSPTGTRRSVRGCSFWNNPMRTYGRGSGGSPAMADHGVRCVRPLSPCDDGLTLCDGACVDRQRDPAHCGGCGQACDLARGQACQEGACTEGCRIELSPCAGSCVDLQQDPRHCGECGRVCPTPDHGQPGCRDGECAIAFCSGSWVDAGLDAANGCECLPAVDPTELCNSRDDDCDGATDEGFDLRADPVHCGTCDTICRSDHGTAICAEGRCRVTSCDDGWRDLNGRGDDGCEYECQERNGGVEQCNGLDDDCNGRTDADDPSLQLTPCEEQRGACAGSRHPKTL